MPRSSRHGGFSLRPYRHSRENGRCRVCRAVVNLNPYGTVALPPFLADGAVEGLAAVNDAGFEEGRVSMSMRRGGGAGVKIPRLRRGMTG